MRIVSGARFSLHEQLHTERRSSNQVIDFRFCKYQSSKEVFTPTFSFRMSTILPLQNLNPTLASYYQKKAFWLERLPLPLLSLLYKTDVLNFYFCFCTLPLAVFFMGKIETFLLSHNLNEFAPVDICQLVDIAMHW